MKRKFLSLFVILFLVVSYFSVLQFIPSVNATASNTITVLNDYAHLIKHNENNYTLYSSSIAINVVWNGTYAYCMLLNNTVPEPWNTYPISYWTMWHFEFLGAGSKWKEDVPWQVEFSNAVENKTGAYLTETLNLITTGSIVQITYKVLVGSGKLKWDIRFISGLTKTWNIRYRLDSIPSQHLNKEAVKQIFFTYSEFYNLTFFYDDVPIKYPISDIYDEGNHRFYFDINVGSLTVGQIVVIDPSIIATSELAAAVSLPNQRKIFYAAGLHWAIITGKYYTSPDGITWTYRETISGSSGESECIWFDGSYLNYVYIYGYAIWWDQYLPNANGILTFQNSKVVVVPYEDDNGNSPATTSYKVQLALYNAATSYPNIFTISPRSYGGGYEDYTTEVHTDAYAATNKFVFNPYQTVTTPVGTTLPTTIQKKGWKFAGDYSNKISFLEYYLQMKVKVKNPTAVVHAGNLYARLWRSPNENLSNAVALTPWCYNLVSFNGTAGQTVVANIILDLTKGVGDAWAIHSNCFYIELLWDVTTAGANGRVQVEGLTASYMNLDTLYFRPHVYMSIGITGLAISFVRQNGYSYYPYVLLNGQLGFRSEDFRKLSVTWDSSWDTNIVPLTGANIYVLYSRSYVYGQAYISGTWGSQETPTTSGLAQKRVSAIGDGGDVYIALLKSSVNDIFVVKRTGATGTWGSEVTIQASTTSTSIPAMTLQSSGVFKVFWAATNHIYYKTVTNMVPDANPTDWINESTETITYNYDITTFASTYSNIIAIMYETKTVAPYNVKFALFLLAQELSFTFTETMKPSATLYQWQEHSYIFQQTITSSETVIYWQEYGYVLIETITPSDILNLWQEQFYLFSESINPSATLTHGIEMLFTFFEYTFTETLRLSGRTANWIFKPPFIIPPFKPPTLPAPQPPISLLLIIPIAIAIALIVFSKR